MTQWYRVAAVFALISLVSWFAWRTYAGRTIAVQTANGQNQQITLPDGSLLTLNSNSTLSYPANLADLLERRVLLDGEAYFRVTKQRRNGQPVKFTVHSADLDIDVTGTQFNVKNRRGTVNIALYEGAVQVSQSTDNRKQPELIMKPGDLVEFSATRKTLRKRHVSHPEYYSSWTKNVLIFSNTPLGEIAQLMADSYGVTVTFADESMADLAFTGNVLANDPAVILETLAKAFDLQTLRSGNDKVLFEAK